MTMLSMELCKGTSWWNPANTRLECSKIVERPLSLKIIHTPIAYSKKLSFVQHCGSRMRESTKPHNNFLQLRDTVNHAFVAVTGGFGKPTTSTSNDLKHTLHQLELHLYNGCATEESNTSSKTLKNLKRIKFYLMRDADVALHSVLSSVNECRTTRMMIPGQFQWYYSIKDFTNLKKSMHPIPMPMTIPRIDGGKLKKWEVGVGVGEDMPAKYQDDDPVKQAPQRRCGVLLHPTSLPGPHGIGDLGKDAYKFIDWLKETGCTVWQVLPLIPPGRRGGEDGSPYAGADANCGNTLLISLECLVKDGLLETSDLPTSVPVKRMNSTKVAAVKDPLVTKAAAKLVGMKSGKLKEELEVFRKDPKIAAWVEEAALFAAIDQSTKATTWWTWPSHLRDRDPNAMKAARNEHKSFIDIFVAAQFLFQRQWQALHKYANDAGIKIMGDMPIYIGGHSADVWAHRSLFDLDPKIGIPITVSGVPPDALSATGQLWGSPLYNWKEMAKDKYSWWATRILRAYELFDEFRIDHFRGFAGYWAIPANAQNAMSGKWKAGPGKGFFTAMKEAVGKRIDIVAEDLGVITTDVVALRKELHAPGMAVLQFAFGGNSRNPHLLHNHEFDQVVYPGTHDNDTCLGWWKKATEEEKERAKKYLRFHKDTDVHWEFIRGAAASVARTAIIPMQDVMGLDNSARMNIPATQAGNWGWRMGESDVFEKLDKEKKRLRKFLCRYSRLTPEFQQRCKLMTTKRTSSEAKEKEASSAALSSVAKTIGKPLESSTGVSVVGEAEQVAEKAKEKVDKAKEKAPGTFEKLKEKLKEKASKPLEKFKEKPKDDKSKDKPNKADKPEEKPGKEKPNKDNGKDKRKENPKKK